MSNEYQGGSTNYSGCSYNSLCNISKGAMAPSGDVPSMSCQIIPNWPGSPNYDALTHGGKCSCGGHFAYANAYPWPCETQYSMRPCASGCPNDVTCGAGPAPKAAPRPRMQFQSPCYK